MANVVFNVAKGRVNELHRRVNGNDPATSGLIIVLAKVAASDASLIDEDTLATVLAGATDECDFTNYARKIITDADIVDPTVDDTNDRQDADIADQTYVSAGGGTNNNVVALIICFAPDVSGADSTLIPLTKHDFVVTTDGTDIVAQVATAGYFRAA